MCCAISAAAVGLARSSAFARMVASFAGFESIDSTARESDSVVRSDCRIISAAPEAASALALAV